VVATLFIPGDLDGVVTESGEVVISRNDAAGFAGTFNLDLATPNHRVSLTNGSLDTSGLGARTPR
jgi:hypothetical protein